MRAFVMQLHRMALLVALTLSLVATGFAHRLPDAEDQTVAAMLASGAALSDICGELALTRGHADPLCQACQIAGGADVPPLAGAVVPAALVLVAEVTAPRESRRIARVLDPARTPQGPPVA
jgi:hypothetical protein